MYERMLQGRLIERRPVLTNEDHRAMKRWLGSIVRGLAEGILSLDDVDAEVGHVVGAIDIGNIGEARAAMERAEELLVKPRR